MANWRPAAFAMFTVGWGANSFTALLSVYREQLGLSSGAVSALFGVYALGLIPSLLLGGPATGRVGARRLVRAAVPLAAVATAITMLGSAWAPGLALGRLLTGVAAGVAFSAGTAWVNGLSASAGEGVGPRRVAVALSTGFAAGPLATALLATWVPAPLVLSYLPHVLLCAVAAAMLRDAVDHRPAGRPAPALILPRVPAFWTGVAPAAPWVFGCATAAFAGVPMLVSGISVAGVGALTALTLGVGAVIQPLSRRLQASTTSVAALVVGALGFAIAGIAIAVSAPLLVGVAAVPLGAAYGLGLSGGLRQVEQLAAPADRARLSAFFLALTYLGFAAPYLLVGLDALVGGGGALAVATIAMLGCAGWVARSGSARHSTVDSSV